ncbi:MAG: hypothetical protein ACYC91_17775 [Solirubrobacteraceae bacterium]
MSRVARIRLGSSFVGVSIVAGIYASIALSAASAPTGNKSAIRFYRASQAAMARFQRISFTSQGTSYRIVHEGFDNFSYDFGSVPHGYSRAIAHVIVVQRNGRVVEEIDTLKARGLPTVRVWRFRSDLTAIGRVLDRHGCPVLFDHDNNSFVNVDAPFVTLNGSNFAPLERRGANELVRSSYPSNGGTFHEADTINASSRLWSVSVQTLKGGPFNGARLFEDAYHYGASQRFESPPQLGRCV